MSGFIYYLIMYYSKYFGGNFYLNYSFLGFADCLALYWVGLLSKKLRVIGVVLFITCAIIFLSLLLIFVNSTVSEES